MKNITNEYLQQKREESEYIIEAEGKQLVNACISQIDNLYEHCIKYITLNNVQALYRDWVSTIYNAYNQLSKLKTNRTEFNKVQEYLDENKSRCIERALTKIKKNNPGRNIKDFSDNIANVESYFPNVEAMIDINNYKSFFRKYAYDIEEQEYALSKFI